MKASSGVLALATGLVLLTACQQEPVLNSLWQFDVFQQNRMNAVDLLVIIDNSCSMVEEQDNLAQNFNALISTFEEAEVDWRIAVTTTDVESERFRGLLVGGDDEIIVRAPGGEIDRVEYDRKWPFEAGKSLQLSGDLMRFSLNDSRASWCLSDTGFSSESFGTPGQRNPSCTSGQPVDTDPPVADDGPRAPTAGNLVVSEIMARSVGQDSLCEWVELTNTTDDTLDLSGVVVKDGGRNHAALPSGTHVAPYDVVVIGRSTDTAANCDTPVDVAFPSDLSLMDDVRFIENHTPDAEEIFGEMVAQGTTGTGIEMGLENARLVFEEPYYSEQNASWMREDASLSLLFVSDEEDSSPHPVDAYVRYFTDLKGDRAYRDRSLVNISAVVGKDPPPREDVPSCETENGVAWYGKRYLAAANITEGLAESICAEDFAPIITNLGLTISGLALEFELSTLPDLDTLTVNLYEGETAETLVRELERDVDYSYLYEGNLIRFEENQVPPSEYFVVAEYRQLPTGATLDSGDTGAAE